MRGTGTGALLRHPDLREDADTEQPLVDDAIGTERDLYAALAAHAGLLGARDLVHDAVLQARELARALIAELLEGRAAGTGELFGRELA